MPSRFRLRRIFAPLIRRTGAAFIMVGISANAISVLAFLLAVGAAALLILFQWYPLFGVLVFLVGFLDGVDGEVARRTGQASPAGGYLDSILDRLSDSLLLLPFLWFPTPLPQLGPTWVWVFAALTGVLLVSYIRSRATAAGVTDTDVGLAARSERLFLLVIATLLSIFHPWTPFLGLVLLTGVSHLTVIYRLLYYRNQLRLA